MERNVSEISDLHIEHFIKYRQHKGLKPCRFGKLMEYIGGQALIEGVMILSKENVGIALQKKKGIFTKTSKRPKFARIFGKIWFVRGIAALIEMFYVGTKALIFSAEEAETDENGFKEETPLWQLVATLALSIGFAVGLFVAAPFFIAHLLFQKGVLFNVIEGVIRVILFFGYLIAIAHFKDIQRVFQYHGAEHMAVHCYESKKSLSVRNVKKFPTAHPRCGTSFLVIVLVVAIFVFSFITADTLTGKLALRVLLVPIIAGISYEILKIGAKFSNAIWMKPLLWPGLLVQKITTKQPDDKQIKVAIAAVEACIGKYA